MHSPWYLSRSANKAIFQSKLGHAARELDQQLQLFESRPHEIKLSGKNEREQSVELMLLHSWEKGRLLETIRLQAYIIALLFNGLGDGEDPLWAWRRRRIEVLRPGRW
jgi:hypothetical protein